MFVRQLLFLAILALPPVAFAVLFQSAAYLAALVAAPPLAWWCASPVTWPAWIGQGLVRALPAAAAITLVLWLTR